VASLTSRPKNRGYGAVAGVVSAGVGVGVAQLVAGIFKPEASPIAAVGQTFIDAMPEWLKGFAIRAFGTRDKSALLTGMAVVIAVLAAAVGVVSVRRLRVGLAGVGGLALVGLACVFSRPGARPLDVLPTIAGGLAAGVTLVKLHARLPQLPSSAAATAGEAGEMAPSDGSDTGAAEAAQTQGLDRRGFLVASALGAVAAFVAGGLGRLLTGRSAANLSRAEVRIPYPVSPLPSPPLGTDLHVPGLGPFITSTDAFFKVDTALVTPSVTAENWRLRIHGMVGNEMALGYKELLARPLVERGITIACVSNPVGGDYIGNARWVGVLLAPILREAGVTPDATQIVTRSVDGFTIGTPTAAVMEGRDAMLAVAMNGEPLPLVHGFPVRMIVPGLFGYVSAMKWLMDMELTTFEAFNAYWVRQGWAQQAPVITESRIDTPRSGATLHTGEVPVAGVAWAPQTGIASVEIQVDDGPWQSTELAAQDGIDTWRMWIWRWNAPAGTHTLKVRATDQTGYTQTPIEASPFPNGATGLHTITVKVA